MPAAGAATGARKGAGPGPDPGISAAAAAAATAATGSSGLGGRRTGGVLISPPGARRAGSRGRGAAAEKFAAAEPGAAFSEKNQGGK